MIFYNSLSQILMKLIFFYDQVRAFFSFCFKNDAVDIIACIDFLITRMVIRIGFLILNDICFLIGGISPVGFLFQKLGFIVPVKYLING